MKSSIVVGIVALGLVARGFAAEPPSDVVVIDHTKVAAAFAKSGPLEINSRYKVQAGRRDADGQVEIHTYDTDVFYITEGTATLTTGGTAIEPKQIAPGELRADKATGGTARQITKGDVIIIPAGIPHLITNVTKPFLYFVVKVTK